MSRPNIPIPFASTSGFAPQAQGFQYPNIERGTSLTIPISLTDVDDEPIDISEFLATLTVKKVVSDWDWRDDRAYIQKEVTPQEPLEGKWWFELSSEDTYFEPGRYFFDIQLTHIETGSVTRFATFVFNLVGGPTNRTVNPGLGQTAYGSEILIIITQAAPIINIVPFSFASSASGDGIYSISVEPDSGLTIDNTDPRNPIIGVDIPALLANLGL